MPRTILSPAYIIRQYERGIVEFFGGFSGFVETGLHFQLPFVQLTRVRDIREHTMDIEPQAVITKDNVEIHVDGIIWVRPGLSVEEIKRTFYNIDDWKRATIELAKTNLRQEFGGLTLDESLIARERISSNLQDTLDRLERFPYIRRDIEDVKTEVEVFFGVELNYEACDGEFCYSEEIHEAHGFEVVIGGIHSTYTESQDMREVLEIQHRHFMRTLNNPLLNVLVHPFWFGIGLP